jgi:Tol biopolymer transport system component
LADARRQRADALRLQADAAEGRRDWPAAERALAALLAVDPGDAAVADRLAALQRQHAPLVLALDRALWLVGPDGADERLLADAVPAAWPTWSPDRARIAFTSPDVGGEIALYVVGADGSGLTRLADGLRPYVGPAWSPDGTRIAFATEGGWADRANQVAPDPAGIRVVEVATGLVADVTGGRVREPLYPTWSPTGDRLAFVSRDPEDGFGAGGSTLPAGAVLPSGEVYVATLATGAIANVSAGRVPHPWRVAWSPADERILVYTREPGMSYDRDRVRVVLLDARDGRVADLPSGNERITMPVWSPDGERVAYVAGEQEVVVRAVDGSAVTRIDLDAVLSRFLTWSPDGGALVAVAENAERPSFLVPLDDPERPR